MKNLTQKMLIVLGWTVFYVIAFIVLGVVVWYYTRDWPGSRELWDQVLGTV